MNYSVWMRTIRLANKTHLLLIIYQNHIEELKQLIIVSRTFNFNLSLIYVVLKCTYWK